MSGSEFSISVTDSFFSGEIWRVRLGKVPCGSQGARGKSPGRNWANRWGETEILSRLLNEGVCHQGHTLLNVGKAEAHFTFVLGGLIIVSFRDRAATA